MDYEKISVSCILGMKKEVLMPISTVQRFSRAVAILLSLSLAAFTLPAQQSFPVISTVDEPAIAGRPVQVDAQKKLLPWPMPDNTGYSYSSHFLSQWTILWDQNNRQRLPGQPLRREAGGNDEDGVRHATGRTGFTGAVRRKDSDSPRGSRQHLRWPCACRWLG